MNKLSEDLRRRTNIKNQKDWTTLDFKKQIRVGSVIAWRINDYDVVHLVLKKGGGWIETWTCSKNESGFVHNKKTSLNYNTLEIIANKMSKDFRIIT